MTSRLPEEPALRRLGTMTAAFVGSDAARAAIGFALSIAVGRGLGADAFGRWTLCLAWASALTVAFDLGFGVLLTREAARPDGDVGPLVRSAIVLRVIAFLPIGIVVALMASRIVNDPASVAALRAAVIVAAFGLAYGCFAAVMRATPRSLTTVLVIEALALAVHCAAAIAIVRNRGSVAALLVLAAGVQAAQLALAAACCRSHFLPLRGRRSSLWKAVEKVFNRDPQARPPTPSTQVLQHLRRALPFAAAGLAANAQSRVAPIALGFMAADAQVAAFGAAWRLGNAARRLPHAVFGAALPVLSHEAGRTTDRGGRLHGLLDRSVTAFAALVAIVLIAWPEPILRMTYGPTFSTAAPTLQWIGLALLPTLMNASRKIYLYACDDEAVAVRWTIVALAVQVAGSLILIPRFGAGGAAAALAIAEGIVFFPIGAAVRRSRALPRATDVADLSIQPL